MGIWTNLISTGSPVWANAVHMSTEGTIYVAGGTDGNLSSEEKNGDYQAFLGKFNTDGSEAWLGTYSTRSFGDAKAVSGNLTDTRFYIAGDQVGGNAIFITEWFPNGTRGWATGLVSDDTTDLDALTVSSDGSVYIAGTTFGSIDGWVNQGERDAYIAKFSPDKSLLWSRMIGTEWSDSANALTTDSQGYIYLAGNSEGDLNGRANTGRGYYDTYVSKYTPDGDEVWTRLIGTTEDDYVRDIALGSDGYVYTTGTFYSSPGYKKAFVSKISVDGQQSWVKVFDDISNPVSLVAASDNSVFLVNGGGTDPVVLSEIDNMGTRTWTEIVRIEDRDQYEEVRIEDIDVDANDAIIIVGSVRPKNSYSEAFITKVAVSRDSDTEANLNHSLDVIVDLFGQVLYLKGLTETVSSTAHTIEYEGTSFNYSDVDGLLTTVVRDGEFTEEFAKEIADAYPSVAGISYSTAVALVGASAIEDVLIAVAGADGDFIG